MAQHEASFDIRTAPDFLHKLLIPQHKDFTADNASSRHAVLAIILAYHIYEWVHGRSFTREHFRKLYPDKVKMIDLFGLAGAISNGTKHFAPRAKTTAGVGFSSEFSEEFERPLNIEFPQDTVYAPYSGQRISADSLLKKLVTFWKDQLEKPG